MNNNNNDDNERETAMALLTAIVDRRAGLLRERQVFSYEAPRVVAVHCIGDDAAVNMDATNHVIWWANQLGLRSRQLVKYEVIRTNALGDCTAQFDTRVIGAGLCIKIARVITAMVERFPASKWWGRRVFEEFDLSDEALASLKTYCENRPDAEWCEQDEKRYALGLLNALEQVPQQERLSCMKGGLGGSGWCAWQ